MRIDVAAGDEIEEAALWYEREGAGLGQRFLDSIEAALARILQNPRQFPPIPRFSAHPELRRALVDSFPYAIVFALSSEEIRVVAVAHTRRRPGYWLSRLDS